MDRREFTIRVVSPAAFTVALFFGIGFGTAYPTYVGYVMKGVSSERRGAAFQARTRAPQKAEDRVNPPDESYNR